MWLAFGFHRGHPQTLFELGATRDVADAGCPTP